MNDNQFVSNYFNVLLSGDPSVITSENNERLNKIAMELYGRNSNLNSEELDTLKKIIYICNIIYNRTDMSIPVISDGFYDLLNEVYKRYDPNFQVGSFVITFKDHFVNDSNSTQQMKLRTPVYEIKRDNVTHKDELHEEIFNNISRFYPLNQKDFIPNIAISNQGNISKRYHDTKHNHPTLVGTLDKAKFVLNHDAIEAGVFNDPNVKVLERDFFGEHIKKGIINPNDEIEIICELKYDGISIEADCTDRVISARSRGNTGMDQASDMTPILKDYLFKHAIGVIDNPIGIKFEAIITGSNLGIFNQRKIADGLDPYKNGRTAIVGLFGSSDGYKYRDLITLVPLAVDRDECSYIKNRLEEIEFLNKLYVTQGNPLRYAYFKGTLPQILFYVKAFLDEANLARNYLDFMYDGIVVSYLNEDIRARLGRVNSINKYSMAVKFDPMTKETVFRGYTFTIGQNGQVTPMIHYDPVEFYGTIHTKSTGSSYERFTQLGLKYGDFISVSYVNDVMPYVTKLECDHNRNNSNPLFPFPTNCPLCGTQLVFSESGKTAICTNKECPGRSVSRMTNMFSKLGIKGFGETTFQTLSEIDHLYKLFEHDLDYYKSKLGEADGQRMGSELEYILYEPHYDYTLMGSLGFTGIAQKKWRSILTSITIKDLYKLYKSHKNNKEKFRLALLQNIENLGDVTSTVIANEFEYFEDDIKMVLSLGIIDSYGADPSRVEIRFTGCRNLQLSEQLCNLGYDADQNSGVTKSTDILLIPYKGFTSNKVSKVSDKCLIIPINEFIDNMQSILARYNN